MKRDFERSNYSTKYHAVFVNKMSFCVVHRRESVKNDRCKRMCLSMLCVVLCVPIFE
jgi:hypothetical protein